MRLTDLGKLSTRMFKARTSRTLLTILGMGVGIGAILFLVSMGYGLQKVLLETITTSDSLLSLDVAGNQSKGLVLSEMEILNIKKVEGVAEVSPAWEVKSQVKFNDLTSDSKAVVIEPNFLKLDGTKIAVGKGLDDNEPNGVVISSAFAKIFNQTPQEIEGKEIAISLFKESGASDKEKKEVEKIEVEQKLKIIGIVEEEDVITYLNKKIIENKVTIENYSRLKVKCKNSDYLNQVREALEKEGYVVSSLSDTVDQANKVFRIIQIVLAFFGVIALIVSAIGMFNTMTVALLERTEEIGIMKSIGASDVDIMMMFIAESTIMGFFGGLTGIGLGIITGKIFNLGVNFLASHFGGQSISLFYYPAWFLIFILGFATFVGLLTGIIPARRASSIDPLDALRYK